MLDGHVERLVRWEDRKNQSLFAAICRRLLLPGSGIEGLENLKRLAKQDGCTMPVSKDRDLTRETPKLDRIVYTFGPVHRTQDWRAKGCGAIS